MPLIILLHSFFVPLQLAGCKWQNNKGKRNFAASQKTKRKTNLSLRPVEPSDFWEAIHVSRTRQGIRGGFFTTNCFLFFRVLYTIHCNSHSFPLQNHHRAKRKNNLIKYHLSGTTCDDIIEYYSTHAALMSDWESVSDFELAAIATTTMSWCLFVHGESTKNKIKRGKTRYTNWKLISHYNKFIKLHQ